MRTWEKLRAASAFAPSRQKTSDGCQLTAPIISYRNHPGQLRRQRSCPWYLFHVLDGQYSDPSPEELSRFQLIRSSTFHRRLLYHVLAHTAHGKQRQPVTLDGYFCADASLHQRQQRCDDGQNRGQVQGCPLGPTHISLPVGPVDLDSTAG